MISEGFIDIHMHVIPDVDDGAADMRMSLSMLDIAYNEGIRTIICTPHYGELGKPSRPKEYIDEQFTKLVKAAGESHPDLVLLRGNELYFRRDIPKIIRDGRACSMNGTSYLLIEFDPEERAKDIYDDLAFLVNSGYKPILAHAERSFELEYRRRAIDKILQLGVLLQVNADSIMLEKVKPFKKLARSLVEEGKASFIATDSHGDDYRVPYLMPAVDWLYSKCSEDYADALLRDNALQMLIDANS